MEPDAGAVMLIECYAIEPSGTSTLNVPIAAMAPVALPVCTSQVTLTAVPANVSLKISNVRLALLPAVIVEMVVGQSPLVFDILFACH